MLYIRTVVCNVKEIVLKRKKKEKNNIRDNKEHENAYIKHIINFYGY